MRLIWDYEAWLDYLSWQTDKKALRRVNLILSDIVRSPFDGIAKPEPLKGNLAGMWSRRINETDHIVYRVKDNAIEILQCKTHYDNV